MAKDGRASAEASSSSSSSSSSLSLVFYSENWEMISWTKTPQVIYLLDKYSCNAVHVSQNDAVSKVLSRVILLYEFFALSTHSYSVLFLFIMIMIWRWETGLCLHLFLSVSGPNCTHACRMHACMAWCMFCMPCLLRIFCKV